MEQTIKKQLDNLESAWLDLLFEHLQSEFSRYRLPSHDHWHHLRVWNFIKSILFHLENCGIVFNLQEIKNLMVAAFFHDVGLTRTVGEWHGKAGAELCREFIQSGTLSGMPDLSSALDAIEKHDDKDYKNITSNIEKPSILSVLSLADDLDAFGNTGIVRYAEIYMLRKIALQEIPGKVINNAEKRMNHVRQKFYFLKEFLGEHERRYLRLDSFFRSIKDEEDTDNPNLKILQHIKGNLDSGQNNENLTDLLKPVDSQFIEQFRNKILEEQKGG
jgi:HD superfamily phosphodiesterase